MSDSSGAEPLAVTDVISTADAELIAGYLRSSGIPAAVQTIENTSGKLPSPERGQVFVMPSRLDEARQLLAHAEHQNPADPGSELDVGLPIDDDVRDYLAWRRGSAAPSGGPPSGGPLSGGALSDGVAQPVPAADEQHEWVQAVPGLSTQHARGLPLLPLVLVAAVVVAVVVWLR